MSEPTEIAVWGQNMDHAFSVERVMDEFDLERDEAVDTLEEIHNTDGMEITSYRDVDPKTGGGVTIGVVEGPDVRHRINVEVPDIDEILRAIEQLEGVDPDMLSPRRLADLYIASSDGKSEIDDHRKRFSGALDEKMEGDSLECDRGSVSRVHREKWSLKDENLAYRELTEKGVEPEEIMSIDEDLVEEKCEELGIQKEELFDHSQWTYIRKN